MKKKIKIGATIAVAFLAIVLIWEAFERITYGGKFVLNHNGKEWRYDQDPKKLNLVYFGFTKCGSVCPLTLSATGEAFHKLTSEELKNVRLLFVSVDYEHDKPGEVAQYAAGFFHEFIGLTGKKEQIDVAVKLFPAGYIIENNPDSPLGYTVMHTDKIFYMDRQGKMIDYLKSPRNPDEILTKIRKCLKEY